MTTLSFDDIRQHVGAASFDRGMEYLRAGRVTQVTRDDADENSALASVQGTRKEPYNVDVEWWQGPYGVEITSHCSCPMRGQCKHVAATLVWLSEAGGGYDVINPQNEIAAWLQSVERATNATAVDGDTLLYVLHARAEGSLRNASITVYSERVARAARPGTAVPVMPPEFFNPHHLHGGVRLRADDAHIVNQLLARRIDPSRIETKLAGIDSVALLERIIATGRCRLERLDGVPVHIGSTRTGHWAWQPREDGAQQLQLHVTPAADVVLDTDPISYIDSVGAEWGPLTVPQAGALVKALLKAPPIPAAEVPKVSAHLRMAAASLPTPRAVPTREVEDVAVTPTLQLTTRAVHYGRSFSVTDAQFTETVAVLGFFYGDLRVPPGHDPVATVVQDDVLWRITRQREREAQAIARLSRTRLAPRSIVSTSTRDGAHAAPTFVAPDSATWLAFLAHDVPLLRAEGWRIELADSFSYRLASPTDWYAAFDESGEHGWFDFDLGVTVEGEKINLLPVLIKLLHSAEDTFSLERLQALPEGVQLSVQLPDERWLMIPAERLRVILATLIELFDKESLSLSGKLRMPRQRAIDAARMESALTGDDWHWLGGQELRALATKVNTFTGVRPVAVPPEFCGELRNYQHDGLNWLQFLREFELGGVLADDMGLGKTIQTLAHLALEKSSGRMDRPSLIVAPTSLMVNWRREAERFAPTLRVLTLHGSERQRHFGQLRDYDVVLTTYALLVRDEAALMEQDYHLLILDEAQYIKNPHAKSTTIVCQLRARHRLALTGTPMENHLGELWSVFDFLQPGLLGDERQFRRLFRNPIEKYNDNERRRALARRVAPFLLRRTKERVAPELPRKTEIVRVTALGQGQRDMYETVRLAMHAKVQQAIANKGLSRSHIDILEALLKLRQICCDPRLLKAETIRRVKESAKLELLMTLLPELISEGRRILLFSQFTSMLALIEPELKKLKLSYVKLIGDTKDRDTPVRRFQDGEVPLFLISLKAGGTGLNLTAADTVIHYDPWWNPAVEAQATDRAHRIGQEKPVFVYKLLTEGTVEERMAEMQQRKRALAQGVLEGEGAQGPALAPEDLAVLLAPLA